MLLIQYFEATNEVLTLRYHAFISTITLRTCAIFERRNEGRLYEFWMINSGSVYYIFCILIILLLSLSHLINFSSSSLVITIPKPNTIDKKVDIIRPYPLYFSRNLILFLCFQSICWNIYCLNMHLSWPNVIKVRTPTPIVMLIFLPNKLSAILFWNSGMVSTGYSNTTFPLLSVY